MIQYFSVSPNHYVMIDRHARLKWRLTYPQFMAYTEARVEKTRQWKAEQRRLAREDMRILTEAHDYVASL